MIQSLKSGAKVIVLSLGLVFVSSIYAQSGIDNVPGTDSEPDEQINRVYGKTGDGSTPAPYDEFKEVPDLYTIASRIFVVLVLMSGLAFVLIRYTKKGKLKLGTLTPIGTEDSLIVSETRMLGNKQYLMVVEYNAQKILIGVSPGSVQHICFLESAFEDEVNESVMSEDYQEA